MRKLALLCCAGLFSSLAWGQIPNSGFENWVTDVDTNYNPVGWQTSNSWPIVNVEQVTPGHGGSYAMKVKTVDLGIVVLPGIAIMEAGFNFTQVPTKFGAWVKSNLVSGDTAFILVGLMKGDTVVAATGDCTFKIDSSYANFTYLEFPIAVVSGQIPDSLYIMVASGLGINPHPGTEIIVDDIAFIDAVTSVSREELRPGLFVLEQNFPNPFNPETAVSYQLSAVSVVRLRVYDMLGRVVATLVDGQMEAGMHRVKWDAAGRPSGTYLIRLEANGVVETRKMALVR